MKAMRSILLGLLLIALVLAPTQVQAAEKAAAKEKPAAKEKAAAKEKTPSLRGAYAVYAKAAGLTAEQEGKILAAVEKSNADTAAIKDEYDKARADYTEARKGSDKDAIAKTKEALDKATAKRAQIASDFDVAARKALNADQVAAWEKAKLEFAVATGYKRYNLTEEQQKKVDALVAEAADAMAKADPADAKAYAAPRTNLLNKVKTDILTEEQRNAAKPAAPAKPEAKEKAKPADKAKGNKKDKGEADKALDL